MTDVNIPLLRKAVEWVEEQEKIPEALDGGWKPNPVREWYQGSWRAPVYDATTDTYCGTTYCVAGYVSEITGSEWRGNGAFVLADEEEIANNLADDYGTVHCSDRAQLRLGLTSEQACELFVGTNRAADVRRLAEVYAGEKL